MTTPHSPRAPDRRRRERRSARRDRQGGRQAGPFARQAAGEGRAAGNLARSRPAPDADRRGDRDVPLGDAARRRSAATRTARPGAKLIAHRDGRLPSDCPDRRQRLGGHRAGRRRIRRAGLVHAGRTRPRWRSTRSRARPAATATGAAPARSASPVRARSAPPGCLGGHLTFAKGVGPDQTVFDRRPGGLDRRPASRARCRRASRRAWWSTTRRWWCCARASALYALRDRCSHRGCSLSGRRAGRRLRGRVRRAMARGSTRRDGSVQPGPGDGAATGVRGPRARTRKIGVAPRSA